jgi:hypothetical protein
LIKIDIYANMKSLKGGLLMEIYTAIPKDVLTGKTRRIGKNHPTALWVFADNASGLSGMAYHSWDGTWLNRRIRRVRSFARALSRIGFVLCRVREPAVEERTPKIAVYHTRLVPLSLSSALHHPDYGADEINPIIISRAGSRRLRGLHRFYQRRFFLEPVFPF